MNNFDVNEIFNHFNKYSYSKEESDFLERCCIEACRICHNDYEIEKHIETCIMLFIEERHAA